MRTGRFASERPFRFLDRLPLLRPRLFTSTLLSTDVKARGSRFIEAADDFIFFFFVLFYFSFICFFFLLFNLFLFVLSRNVPSARTVVEAVVDRFARLSRGWLV